MHIRLLREAIRADSVCGYRGANNAGSMKRRLPTGKLRTNVASRAL